MARETTPSQHPSSLESEISFLRLPAARPRARVGRAKICLSASGKRVQMQYRSRDDVFVIRRTLTSAWFGLSKTVVNERPMVGHEMDIEDITGDEDKYTLDAHGFEFR